MLLVYLLTSMLCMPVHSIQWHRHHIKSTHPLASNQSAAYMNSHRFSYFHSHLLPPSLNFSPSIPSSSHPLLLSYHNSQLKSNSDLMKDEKYKMKSGSDGKKNEKKKMKKRMKHQPTNKIEKLYSDEKSKTVYFKRHRKQPLTKPTEGGPGNMRYRVMKTNINNHKLNNNEFWHKKLRSDKKISEKLNRKRLKTKNNNSSLNLKKNEKYIGFNKDNVGSAERDGVKRREGNKQITIFNQSRIYHRLMKQQHKRNRRMQRRKLLHERKRKEDKDVLTLTNHVLGHNYIDKKFTKKSNETEKKIKKKTKKMKKNKRPNIVLILTDDQDSQLGSMQHMPMLHKYLRQKGTTFLNAFASTPMCCPSRSSILTGMYVHNHNTYTNNDNCSSDAWKDLYEPLNFGTYLKNSGYLTGYFGKYLNGYQGEYTPPGWSYWMALLRNSRYYNYTLKHNERLEKHLDDYYQDYLTDVITNQSIKFFEKSKKLQSDKGVLLVLSMPAPHGPEDSAPQFKEMFLNNTSHRTPSWNFAPNPDKQWLLQFLPKMSPLHQKFTDLLQTKRLQTLQSVDVAVMKIYKMLERTKQLDNTYIIYTSDHGYHLGQYGVVKGKALPYETDVKIPFVLFGPGVPPNATCTEIVLNLDIAPTLLEMAGVETPLRMDGLSIMPLIHAINGGEMNDGGDAKQKKCEEKQKKKFFWRDSFLIERGKLTKRKLKMFDNMEARYYKLMRIQTRERKEKETQKKMKLMTSLEKVMGEQWGMMSKKMKKEKLAKECKKKDLQKPCSSSQELYCTESSEGKIRVTFCPSSSSSSSSFFLASNTTYPSFVSLPSSSSPSSSLLYLSSNKCLCKKPVIQIRKNRSGGGGDSYNEAIKEATVKIEELKLFVNKEKKGKTKGREFEEKKKRKSKEKELIRGGEREKMSDRKKKKTKDGWEQNEIDKMNGLKKFVRHLKENKQSMETIGRVERKNNFQNEKRTHTSTKKIADTQTLLKEIIYEKNGQVVSGEVAGGEVVGGEVAVGEETINTPTVSLLHDAHHIDYVLSDEEEEEEIAYAMVECGCEDEDVIIINRNAYFDDARVLPKNHNPLLHYPPPPSPKTPPPLHNSILHGNYYHSNHIPDLKLWRRRNEKREMRRLRTSMEKNIRRAMTGQRKERVIQYKLKTTHKFPARNDPNCNMAGMECFRMDRHHWKVEPFWNDDPICSCINSNNNTYWCLRTINSTHNFLFCEFITGFISYYDLLLDPHQLLNRIHHLDLDSIHLMHKRLKVLKRCRGSQQCNYQRSQDEEEEEEEEEKEEDDDKDEYD